MDACTWIYRIDLLACVINSYRPRVMLCTSAVSAANMDCKDEKVAIFADGSSRGIRYYSFLLGTDAGADEGSEL